MTSQYSPLYNKNTENIVKVQLNLSNYATKNDIADKVKKVDDRVKKNASDILALDAKLKQKEDNALTNGRDYYRDEMHLLYKCRTYSFKYSGGGTNTWKSTGIDNYSTDSDMSLTANDFANVPTIINNGRVNVKFKCGYYKQSKLIKPNNNNVINVYIVYKLDPVSNTRDDTFTVQNALFGGIKLTKNTDTSKYKYEGYGICFDEGGVFSMGNITDGRNVLIF